MPESTPSQARVGFAEFVALSALCISLVALSIDAILPALPDIGESFAIERANSQQFVITFLFAGLSLGQLIAGPLSDSIGRKNGLYAGFALFIVGSILAYLAPSFEMLLAGRFLQGIGAGGPRIITIAMVRDRYAGREMARVMSYIMGCFILVPAIAPTLGQGIIILVNWHLIFLVFIAIALILCLWLSMRLRETLDKSDRRPFTFKVIGRGIVSVASNRQTRCYMVGAGCIFGAFIGYLNSSPQIFHSYYAVGALFPLYFGMTALSIGAAFIVNARLVRRFGMRYLIHRALIGMALLAFSFFAFEMLSHASVPLPVFMAYIMASAFCMGMLFGNFNALAMEPMGHMAGIAAAVIGCVSLLISVTVGGIIGQLYNGTLMPITLGFMGLSLISLGMLHIAEK